MKVLCTRPYCSNPLNNFPELDDSSHLKTTQQKYCTSCGMYLILGGRYLTLKLLGKGGFGAAFLAIDRYSPTMRQCVVKQFQPEGNLGTRELELAQQLFEREALVLETLGNKHPQIPNLFAFFPLIVPSFQHKNQQEQYFYLVQEFIDGQDLETELKEKGVFSEIEIREVLTEILKILQFVHENNSIHRDIKPSNIMRDRQGVLHLLDFGAVKLVASGSVSNPQKSSTGIYSMGFAPPEQMSGGEVYPSTDLYALAATCLNLLTGKESRDLYDSYNNKWDWRKYAPNISDRLGQILDKMLLPSPSSRFFTAQEVLLILSSSPLPSATAQTTPLNTSTSLQSPASPVVQVPNTPQVAPVKPQITPSPQKTPQPRKPLPIFPILRGAGFTGFEGVLLAIALKSALPVLSLNVMIGIWGGAIGLIIFALLTRMIEQFEMIFIAGVSIALVWFLPILHQILLNTYNLDLLFVIILPVLAGVATITVAALFLLIYKLITRLF
jgi:serine/threonine-protein kinase